MTRKSIILIGMPGAGKSTVGPRLAARLRWPFYDTDALVEQQAGERLQVLLDRLGYVEMRQVEGRVVAEWPVPDSAVIATGGSLVYSAGAMTHLTENSVCIWLEISLRTVKERVQNWQDRGFSRAPDQTLQSVYLERQQLYRKYADAAIGCDGLTQEQACDAIMDALAEL